MIKALIRIATYAVVGPLVGWVGFGLASELYHAWLGKPFAFDLFDFLGQSFRRERLRIIYTFGVIPALLTALLSLWLARPFHGPALWLWAGVVGSTISTLGILAVVWPFLIIGWFLPQVAFSLACAGFLAGVVAAAIADGIKMLADRWRPRQESNLGPTA